MGFTFYLAVVYTILFAIVLSLAYLDFKKKRSFTKFPKVSFIVPVYNDGESVEQTIEAIYKNYPRDKFDLTVINDGSKDNSLSILKSLRKKYKFNLINHIKNMGKVASLNEASLKAKGEYIFVVDSDLILNKKALIDMFSRLESNPKLAAVSCRYKPRNRNFLARLQELDYNMQALITGFFNTTSAIALWGGCSVIKRKALIEVGLFSQGFLTEDVEMALKLGKAGWKVEQSFYSVETFVPRKVKELARQRLRWGTGWIQCVAAHPSVYFRNPAGSFFILFSLLFVTLFMISMNGLLC